MNWNWLKNIQTDNPLFWENYLTLFSNSEVSENRFVVFDCETTGTDYVTDRILSIGAVAVINNQIKVEDSFSIFLKQDVFKSEYIPIHGSLKEEKFVEAEAMIQFLDYIQNATLVGHYPSFDIEMINQALKRLNVGKLKNQYMDTNIMYQKWKHLPNNQNTTIDELCEVFKIKKSDRHTASGDAFITALLFLKLKRKLEL